MRNEGRLSVVALCCLWCSPLYSQAPDKKPQPPQVAADTSKKPGGCVDVTSDASFASVGYDHIVTLKSGCRKTVTCTVKTDVNPDAASVQLDPGESQSVVTWRGSPARVFKADVSCTPGR
jgi:hypothetical protein